MGQSSCEQCNPGYETDTLTEAGASSCTQCPAGEYSAVSTAACQECDVGHFSAAGDPSCSECPVGSYYDQSASSCTFVLCPTGSSGTLQDVCTALPGYSGSVTATTCLVGGYICSGNQWNEPENYYDEDLLPVSCPAGSIGTVPGITGTMLWSGYTFPVTGVWDTISNDGWIFLGWTEFDATVHGQYITNNQYYRMTKVPVDHTDEFFDVTEDVLNNVANQYLAGFSRWVRKAPNASSVAQWDSNLLAAVTTLNLDDTNPQSIVELWNSLDASDWWNVDYQRSTYDVYNIDFNPSSGCVPNAGYSGSITASTNSPNYYTGSIQPCTTGYYQPEPGQDSCNDCPQNGYETLDDDDSYTSSGATQCQPCPAGEYSNDSTTGCETCPAGSSTDSYGESSCTSVTCPAGSIAAAITGTMLWSGYTFPVTGVWDTISNDGWIFLGWTEFDATVHGQYITNNQYYRMTKVPVDHTDEFFDVTEDVLNNVANQYLAGFSRWVRKAPNASSVAQWDSNLLAAVTTLNLDDTNPQSIVELWNSLDASDWWNADYKRGAYDVYNIDFNPSSGCVPEYGNVGNVIATTITPYYINNISTLWNPADHEDDTYSRTYSGWHGMYTMQAASDHATAHFNRGRHSSLDDKCGDTENISSCVGGTANWPSYKRGAWMALFPGAVGPDGSLICDKNTAGSGAHTQGSEMYTDWEVNDDLRWHLPGTSQYSYTNFVSTYLSVSGFSADLWDRVWMQMDLGGDKLITHIVTQGRGYGYTPETGLHADSGVVINGDDGLQRVENYYVKIWPNGTPATQMIYQPPWVAPQEPAAGGNQWVMVGNVDNNTKQYSALLTPTMGRYVRIYPREYRGAPYMRAGVMTDVNDSVSW